MVAFGLRGHSNYCRGISLMGDCRHANSNIVIVEIFYANCYYC